MLSCFSSSGLLAQSQKNGAAPASSDAKRAVSLAESGNCNQAMPVLKKAVRQTSDKELKKRIALDGVHCAMTHSVPYDALDFLAAAEGVA